MGERVGNLTISVRVLILLAILLGFTTLNITYSLSNTFPIESKGMIQYISPLQIKGSYIENSFGQVVRLRGVCLRGFVDGPTGHWIDGDGVLRYFSWDETIVKKNLDEIKGWGMNTIRIFLVIEGWKAGQYQNYVKQLLTWAGERGIYLIVGFGDVKWWSPDYIEGPYPWPPYTNYTSIVADKQDFIDIYANLASELRDFPNVIFEVYGEWGGGADIATQNEWFNVVQKCVDAIRAAGAHQIIDVGWGWGLGGSNTMDWVEKFPLNDSINNIIYDTHIYRSGGGTGVGPDGPSDYESIKEFWQTRLLDHLIFNLNKSLLIGEIGADIAYTDPTQLQQELTAWSNQLQILNEWNANYIAFWWWPTGIYRLHISPDTEGYQAYSPNKAGEILINATMYG